MNTPTSWSTITIAQYEKVFVLLMYGLDLSPCCECVTRLLSEVSGTPLSSVQQLTPEEHEHHRQRLIKLLEGSYEEPVQARYVCDERRYRLRNPDALPIAEVVRFVSLISEEQSQAGIIGQYPEALAGVLESDPDCPYSFEDAEDRAEVLRALPITSAFSIANFLVERFASRIPEVERWVQSALDRAKAAAEELGQQAAEDAADIAARAADHLRKARRNG